MAFRDERQKKPVTNAKHALTLGCTSLAFIQKNRVVSYIALILAFLHSQPLLLTKEIDTTKIRGRIFLRLTLVTRYHLRIFQQLPHQMVD